MPIFLVLLVAALIGILQLGDIPLRTMHTVVFGSLDSFPLLAVPLFVRPATLWRAVASRGA